MRFRFHFFFVVMILVSTFASAQSLISLKWVDAKIGLKIKASGYGWDELDQYLKERNFQSLGERPLLSFGFPLEFSFCARDQQMPVGFAFEYFAGGSFSRAYGQYDFTRLKASGFNAGVYWQQNFLKRFFIRPYVLYSTVGTKLSTFLINQNPSLPFAGAEYHSRVASVALQLQGGAQIGNRFQLGMETFYAMIVDQSDWTLISTNQKTEIPKFTSNGKNLGISFFIYFKIY
jgi:hypothetical protein